MSRFYVGIFFCLTKLKIFVEGRNSVLCFRKFPVAEKFTDKTWGECQDFPSKFFLSHSAEKHRRGTLPCCCFSNFLAVKKFIDNTGGIIKIVFESFCLTVPENFVVEPFSPSLMSGIEKIYASEGCVTIFGRKFLVSQCRKRPYGNPLVFQHFQVSKNFMLQMVMSRFSVESFLFHSPEKFCRGTL